VKLFSSGLDIPVKAFESGKMPKIASYRGWNFRIFFPIDFRFSPNARILRGRTPYLLLTPLALPHELSPGDHLC